MRYACFVSGIGVMVWKLGGGWCLDFEQPSTETASSSGLNLRTGDDQTPAHYQPIRIHQLFQANLLLGFFSADAEVGSTGQKVGLPFPVCYMHARIISLRGLELIGKKNWLGSVRCRRFRNGTMTARTGGRKRQIIVELGSRNIRDERDVRMLECRKYITSSAGRDKNRTQLCVSWLDIECLRAH